MSKYKLKTKMSNHQKVFKVFTVLAGLFLLLSILLVTGVQAQDKTLQRNNNCDCARNRFIIVEDGTFKCGNQDFRFVGVNAREMVHLYHYYRDNGLSEYEAARILYDELHTASEMGVSVIRVYLLRERLNQDRYGCHNPSTPCTSFHNEAGNLLLYLMDFATKETRHFGRKRNVNLPVGEQEYEDYRESRSLHHDLSIPPAPNMRFLISFIDANYAHDRETWQGNVTLGFDRDAYTRTWPAGNNPADPSINIIYLQHKWFKTKAVLNQMTFPDPADPYAVNKSYEENYRPLVKAIVNRFKNDRRIFAWELGNELQTENKIDMKNFVSDMLEAIKDEAHDKKHLVTVGLISTSHATNQEPCPADIYQVDLNGNKIDFGCVHIYNDEGCAGTGQAADINYFSTQEFPYIVGELSFDGAMSDGSGGFLGGASDIASIPVNFDDTTDGNPRTNNIRLALNALYGQLGADGVFQWQFFAGESNHEYSTDARSMDRVLHTDWDELFDVYQYRAHLLNIENCGVGANLIFRSSFEYPEIPADNQNGWIRVDWSNSICGWVGRVDIHNNLPTAFGEQVVDLNTDHRSYIEQSFSTQPGQSYVLRFWHGMNHHCQTTSATFRLVISDEVGNMRSIPYESDMQQRPKELIVIAGGFETTIRFESLSGQHCGATIDNVEVFEYR